jgi:hypothetical protein
MVTCVHESVQFSFNAVPLRQAPFTLSEEQLRGCSVDPLRRRGDADLKEKQS